MDTLPHEQSDLEGDSLTTTARFANLIYKIQSALLYSRQP